MSREREMILEMLKDGKITNDEALKLLDAIGENKSQEKQSTSSNKIFDDSFVDKVTDSISKIGTKTEEAIKKLNLDLSLIHISEPTRLRQLSRMPSSA